MKKIKIITLTMSFLMVGSAYGQMMETQTAVGMNGSVPKTSASANKSYDIKNAVKYVKKEFNIQNSVFYEIGQIDGYYIFEFFYPDSISTASYNQKPYTQVWLAAVNPRLGLLAKILNYVDCSNKMYGIKQYVIYSDFGTNMLSSKTYDTINFENMIPDSISETLINTVCVAGS